MVQTTREIIYSQEARDDLIRLFSYVAERDGVRPALTYIERIETFCERLSTFPQRGLLRDDLLPGLRLIGFERRATIAFHLEADMVVIDRVLYGGRDIEGVFPKS